MIWRPSNILRGPVYDVKGHLAHVRELHSKYMLNTSENCERWTLTSLDTLFPDRIPRQILVQLKDFIDAVYTDDEIYTLSAPTLEMREYLERRAHELSDERLDSATQAVAEFLTEFKHRLPDAVYIQEKTNAPTIPLHELVKDYRELIALILDLFLNATYADNTTFHNLRRKLMANWARLSGIDLEKPTTKKLVNPRNYDGDLGDFLQGTPFEPLFNVQVPFWPSRRAFNEHGAIFAKSGHGKTRALRAIVGKFLQEPDPPALILIDSLGALIRGIADLEVFQTTLKDRLVVLDPSKPEYMPSLNLFALRSSDLVFYLFKAIDQSFTTRQETMISYLMEYMSHVDEPDLLKLINLCETKTDPYNYVIPKLSPFAANFFQRQFFAKGGDKLIDQTKQQIAQRLYTLARIPKFPQIFAGTKSTFDAADIFQNKKVCLINTDARSPEQGGLGEASAIFGRLVLAQCLAAARARPENQRHLALLIVDEAKAYADDQVGLILSDARQFGLGMILASQQPHQLPEGVRREINTNTSIRMMGNIEYSIASQYARDMFTTPEFILSMKSHDMQFAEWACYVSNMTERAVKIKIPFTVIETMPKAKKPPAQTIQHSAPGTPQQQPLPRPSDAATTKRAQSASSPPWTSDTPEPDYN